MDVQRSRKTRTFTLKSDIDNPSHDRRCKHGVRGVRVFKAGTVVTVDEITCVYTYDDGTQQQATACDYYVSGRHVPLAAQQSVNAVLRLADPGVDEEPQSIEHAAEVCGLEPEWFCWYVVEQLISEGRLSAKDLVAAYERRVD
jgi:hypothetical protein